MPRKKAKKLTATKLVKSAARAHVGAPPATRLVPDKRQQKSEKHKPRLSDLLEE